MQIRTIWERDREDEMPWLVDAVDEYTIDSNGGLPDGYADKLKGAGRKELILNVPDSAIEKLFSVPVVKATASVEE